MRKFRIVINKDGRKLTRHIRAADREDAERQARVLGACTPSPRELDLGAAVVLSLTEMGPWKGRR